MVTILTPKVGEMAKIKKGKGSGGRMKGKKKRFSPRSSPCDL
jgi:hypothetical protein